MDRRAFMVGGAATAAVLAAPRLAHAGAADSAPTFSTRDAPWQAAYDRALSVLAANVKVMPYVSAPVLIEGAGYPGIWQECGPHEALVYRKFRPDVARNGHLTFFDLQRADGQLPANNKVTETGFGQIQMVVPIAATAWELARATGDGELLEKAYRGSAAWDGWLMRHRNTRGTGLVEGFCTYDTGHDNSPRWKNIPPQCPNKDATRFPPGLGLPRLCPDLSATVYGGRKALAAMARALGRAGEADAWEERAEGLRRLILDRLYVPEDAAFYDLDAQGKFVRIRGDIITRICGEHVVDQAMFDTIWKRQLHNPKAFWTPVPLPSIAIDDPEFVRPIPPNSWGGAGQGLTALRAARWFDHYGRAAEFGEMMDAWAKAIIADPSMRQQLDPLTGAFTQDEPPGYSPTALVMLDYTWRLVGVVEEGDALHWNIRPAHRAAKGARLSTPTDGGARAEVRYGTDGAELALAGRRLAIIGGGAVRLVTDKAGKGLSLTGIEAKPQHVAITFADGRKRRVTLAANQVLAL